MDWQMRWDVYIYKEVWDSDRLQVPILGSAPKP